MSAVDFHSHILPGIDDGSKSVEESLEMLNMLSEQGVKTVVATPHFYAGKKSVDDFIAGRAKAYGELSAALQGGEPNILLGAEVSYYEGISHLDSLEKLCIENSRLLLLEMPFSKWSEYAFRELLAISGRNITVVLAHIERYLEFQNKQTIIELRKNGILLQSNANFFINLFKRKKACSMLKSGIVSFLGSDCHNLVKRAPNMKTAYSIIEKRLGDRFLTKHFEYVNSFFERDQK